MRAADDKASQHLPSKINRKIRRRIYCASAVATALLIMVIVATILALVVFRIRNPRLSVNSLKILGVNFHYDAATHKVHVNATLELHISVKNPNRANFKFRNGTTVVYHGPTKVGTGVIPPGKIPAGRTVNLTSIVTIVGDGLLPNSSNLSPESLPKRLNLSTSTVMSGRVNVLNVYKHHAVSSTFCNLTVSVAEQRVESQRCMYRIKL